MELVKRKHRNGFLVETTYEEVGSKFNAKEGAKEETLSRLTVTTQSGKVFYADTSSRVDLKSAIDMVEDKCITSTMWKLAKEYNGSRIIEVTIEELKEASQLALLAKGELVGAK